MPADRHSGAAAVPASRQPRFRQVPDDGHRESLDTLAVLDLAPVELARRFDLEFVRGTGSLADEVAALIEVAGESFLLVRDDRHPSPGTELMAASGPAMPRQQAADPSDPTGAIGLLARFLAAFELPVEAVPVEAVRWSREPMGELWAPAYAERWPDGDLPRVDDPEALKRECDRAYRWAVERSGRVHQVRGRDECAAVVMFASAARARAWIAAQPDSGRWLHEPGGRPATADDVTPWRGPQGLKANLARPEMGDSDVADSRARR